MVIPHLTMMWRSLKYVMLWLQSLGHGRVGLVLLLGHQQGTREWKGFGGMFSDVFAMYFTTHFIILVQYCRTDTTRQLLNRTRTGRETMFYRSLLLK